MRGKLISIPMSSSRRTSTYYTYQIKSTCFVNLFTSTTSTHAQTHALIYAYNMATTVSKYTPIHIHTNLHSLKGN